MANRDRIPKEIGIFLIWAIAFSALLLLSLSLVGQKEAVHVLAAFNGSVLGASVLTWLARPALIQGRTALPRIVKRVVRSMWIIAAFIGLVIVSLAWWAALWNGAKSLIGLGLPIDSILLIILIHAGTGVLFLGLQVVTPEDEKIIPIMGLESRRLFSVWRKELRNAWATQNLEQILRVLIDNNPSDIAAFLFWLEQKDVKTASRSMEFVENTPFVRELLAPARAAKVKAIDRREWDHWVEGIYPSKSNASMGGLGVGLKRLIDILTAALAFFIVLLPLAWISLLALALEHRSVRRAFFVSLRVGSSLSLMRRYQFRTIREFEDELPRISRLGRLLVWTQLDQIPALWNVMIGDMSLVGPYSMYPRYLRWKVKVGGFGKKLQQKFAVRPGLVDPASVDALSRPSLYQCDEGCLEAHYNYVRSWSLGNDVVILVKAFLLYWSFRIPNGVHSFINLGPLPLISPTIAPTVLEKVFLPVPPIRAAAWPVPVALRREEPALP